MKLFLSVIFLMLTSIYNVNAQINFQKTYGATNDEIGYSHKQLPDGSYILVGNTISFGTGLTDGNAIKLDKNGVLEWSKTYGSAENESFIDVICTPDNGYLMGGFTFGFGNNNITSSFYLVKTDANGVEQWSKKYSDGGDFDQVDKLALTSDGGYICIGHNSYYATVFKLNINGDLVFSYEYQMAGSGITLGNSLKPTSDGGYIFTGFNRNGASLNDLILIKINDIGIVQWSKSYSAGSLGSMYGEDLVVLSDGSFVVSGYTDAFGAGGTDGLILKTNSDGILQWIHTYGGTDYDRFSGIDVACDGGFAISGSSRSFKNGIDDVFITKTNQNGTIQWAKVYGGTELDEGAYMKIAGDCGLTVSGNTQSYGRGGKETYFIKMNKDGLDSLKCNVLSVSPVHTTPSISVSSIATSPSNWSNELAITSTEKIAMMIETDSVCKQCVAPIADFDFVQNVMTANFLNYSENGSVFYWDFNDGFTDTMASPVHKYLNADNYNIKLIVTNACGSDTLIKKISIMNTGDCLFNIQPGPKRGDDTFIYSLTAYTNSNYYDNSLLPIVAWTWGGVMGVQRSLLRFNLDAICDPNNLVGANLSLFFPVGVPLNGVYDTYNSPSSNDFTLYRITSPWLGNTVTWNNQPTYTTTNAVLIPSAPVNLLGNDVSTMIKDMVVQGNNGFLLKLNTEQIYRTATYASSNWSEPSLRPLLQLVFNPLIASVAFSDSTICPNDTIELKASGGIRYKWFPAKGLSCTDCENPKASPSTDTEYTVYIYSCESCAEIKKVKVFIHDKVSVTNKSLEMCKGDSVQLNASNANSYKWSPAHGLKNSLISNPKASPAVSTKYYVEGINGHCKSYDSVNVKVKVPPLVNIGDGDTTICSDQNIVLDVSQLGGSVLWQNGSVEQTFEVSDTGKYYVQVTNSCGSSSDTLLVYPCCESIDVPNLFTPNGDIYNEYFKIGCLGSGGWHLRIYNRWGSLVYKSDDYQNNWNGKTESDGVYYYYLSKSKLEYSGWVEILR